MSKKVLRLIIPIFLVVLIGVGIWLTSRPVRGTINVVNTSVEQEEKEKSLQTPKNFIGQTISFSYPGSFYIQPNSSETSEFTDRVVLLGQGMLSKKAVITVKNTATPLENISAVQSRRLKPEMYAETEFDLAGTPGLLFTDTADGFEMTGLVKKNDLLVTVSLTSNSSGQILQDELSADFQSIINSWSWQ